MGTTDKTSLGDRMKGFYEDAYRVHLPRRMPVILRVDGKAFHSFTKKIQAEKPFDFYLVESMVQAAGALIKNIDGADFAYTQSDEISVLVHNYKRLNSGAWFDNNIQKMVSVAASIAASTLSLRYSTPAYFDCRAFVLPENEVCNYFIWRQQDCIRNSIQSLARSLYSHKECNNKNGRELQEMCLAKGHDWNDLGTFLKRGSCVVLGEWEKEIPLFSEDRSYINQFLEVASEEATSTEQG